MTTSNEPSVGAKIAQDTFDKKHSIKAWNDGAFPTSDGVVSLDFDATCDLFTSYASTCAGWKNNYSGAAYATRLKAAIADMKFAIAEAEKHPEIAPPQTASNEAMVALALAVSHLDHMAAWITEANCGRRVGIYSFESLGEDMPGIRATLSRPPRPDATAGREEIARIINPAAFNEKIWMRGRMTEQKFAYDRADAILALSSPKQDKSETTQVVKK